MISPVSFQSRAKIGGLHSEKDKKRAYLPAPLTSQADQNSGGVVLPLLIAALALL